MDKVSILDGVAWDAMAQQTKETGAAAVSVKMKRLRAFHFRILSYLPVY